jgi:hypothetical protein
MWNTLTMPTKPNHAPGSSDVFCPASAGDRVYSLARLNNFMACLEPSSGNPDDDSLPKSIQAGPGWPCSAQAFHSREEARQFFISECVLGEGLRRLVWQGMRVADVVAVAGDLYAQCQSLGSPVREHAIRSCLFGACERAGILLAETA